MTLQWDVTVESHRRRTVLVAEYRHATDTSPSKAARIRNRLLTERDLDVPSDAFFLLALSTTFHLWRPGVAPDALPDSSANALPVFRDYLGEISDRHGWASAETIRNIISFWLGDLAASMRKVDAASEAEEMLVTLGVYEQMKGGTVRRECEFER